MIDNLKPYPEYKDSGVPWLGDVPAHWSVLPNRALFMEMNQRNYPDEEMLSVTINQGVIRQKVLLVDSSKRDSSNQDRSNYKLVSLGDITYNKMRAWQGAIGVSTFRGIVSPAYVVMRLRVASHPRYFHHLYRTPHFAKEAERWSYGITSDQWSLRPDHFKRIYSALPPWDEQAAIVRFLDHANHQIDHYIRAKRKLITLLNEQKQAIIHQAVTRGLDPNVPLKPSGVPWLGDIPEHWEVWRSKRLFSSRKELARPNDIQLSATQAYGVIPQEEYEQRVGRRIVKIFRHLEKRRHVEVGDFVISMRSFQGGLERAWATGCIRSSYIILRPTDSVNVDFFSYLFKSPGYIGALQSTANFIRDGQDLNFDNFCAVDLAVPPIEEQRLIARSIAESIANTLETSERTRKELALIREYRTRLIADVVTGQLDVRAVAATLPDEPDQPVTVTDDEDIGDEEAADLSDNGETDE